MEMPPETNPSLTDATKRVAWRLLAIGHNRAELLMVEIQEERERALQVILLVSAIAVLGILAGITITAVVVCAAGPHLLTTLIILTVIYITGTVLFLIKLTRLQRNWEMLSSTRDQLQKDRECLEEHLT
ncbi:MAG TPA: phage holin family protein [Pseudomonadales bacterium]|nr:phage holin family protein [Pseudomonadales bacterium]